MKLNGKNFKKNLMVSLCYTKNKSLSLDEGYGIQLSVNSIKILNKMDLIKLMMKIPTQMELIFITLK